MVPGSKSETVGNLRHGRRKSQGKGMLLRSLLLSGEPVSARILNSWEAFQNCLHEAMVA